jgi:GT2 family glycosyltransferase
MSSAPPTKTRISVIIPSYNRKDVLSNLLEFLVNEPELPADFDREILVTDDRSKDGTWEMVTSRYPQVRIIEGPGQGLEKNKRAAVEVATGDFVVFLDDDCMPHPGWITTVIPHLRRGEKLVQAKLIFLDHGQVLSEDETPETFRTGYRWDLLPIGFLQGGARPQYINSCSEAALFISRDVLRKVPLDDPNLWADYGAAASFYYRITAAGYKVFFEPKAVVDHIGADTGGCKETEKKKSPKRDCDDYTTRLIHNLVILGRMNKMKRLPLVIAYYLAGSLFLSLRQKKNCFKYFYRGISKAMAREFVPTIPYEFSRQR